jgi:hypothetical protein
MLAERRSAVATSEFRPNRAATACLRFLEYWHRSDEVKIDLVDETAAPSKRGASQTILLLACSVAILTSLLLPARARQAEATPVFAQAYGLKCTACDLQVPILNAFGRYIQRTGYGALNEKTLQHAFPVFLFDSGTNYTYQGGLPSHAYKIADPGQATILYAAGALGPKFRFNAEQGVTLNGEPGWLLGTSISYSGLLGGKGHLIVGKLPALNLDKFGGPSLLSDVTNDAQPAQFVEQVIHNYYFDYNQGRWGGEFNLVEPNYALEVAYFGDDSNSSSSITPTIFRRKPIERFSSRRRTPIRARLGKWASWARPGRTRGPAAPSPTKTITPSSARTS